jgi:hypothetical protein
MAANAHIVGRIEESRIGTRSLANDSLQKSGIAAVTTPHPVLAEKPDVTRPRPRRCRNRGDDLIIGIGSRQNNVDLAGRKTGQGRIDIDIDRSERA